MSKSCGKALGILWITFPDSPKSGLCCLLSSPLSVICMLEDDSQIKCKVMAWWTHIIFTRNHFSRSQRSLFRDELSLGYLRHTIREYLYENIAEILYFLFGIVTYLYLAIAVVVFFFEKSLPPILPRIIEIFAEPYLGVLGVYVVVKEIERRRGHVRQRAFGELFAIIWFFFLVVATLFTFFSENYYASELYKTVVTNALAAMIIRIGTLIR